MEYAASLSGLSAEEQKLALAEYDASIKSSNEAKTTKTTTGAGLSGLLSGSGPGPGGPGSSDAGTSTPLASTTAKKALWYVDAQGRLAVRMVGVGASDGAKTEIIGADDMEGAQVILREKGE